VLEPALCIVISDAFVACFKASSSASQAPAFVLRELALSLDQQFSMGKQSGEYGDRSLM
jgi:hypothetical protein